MTALRSSPSIKGLLDSAKGEALGLALKRLESAASPDWDALNVLVCALSDCSFALLSDGANKEKGIREANVRLFASKIYPLMAEIACVVEASDRLKEGQEMTFRSLVRSFHAFLAEADTYYNARPWSGDYTGGGGNYKCSKCGYLDMHDKGGDAKSYDCPVCGGEMEWDSGPAETGSPFKASDLKKSTKQLDSYHSDLYPMSDDVGKEHKTYIESLLEGKDVELSLHDRRGAIIEVLINGNRWAFSTDTVQEAISLWEAAKELKGNRALGLLFKNAEVLFRPEKFPG